MSSTPVNPTDCGNHRTPSCPTLPPVPCLPNFRHHTGHQYLPTALLMSARPMACLILIMGLILPASLSLAGCGDNNSGHGDTDISEDVTPDPGDGGSDQDGDLGWDGGDGDRDAGEDDGGDGDSDSGDTLCICTEVNTCCDGCNPRDIGVVCDSGLTCAINSTCSENGICRGVSPCEALNPQPECNAATCNEEAGCVWIPIREGFECTPPEGFTVAHCVAGQCTGTTPNEPQPVLEPLLDAGDDHTCIRLADGTIKCWGSNGSERLGMAETEEGYSTVPVPSKAGAEWAQISAGGEHTCGLNGSGQLECWGSDRYGQLGTGTGGLGEDNNGWRNGQAGGQHSCGLHLDGSLWCWGINNSGQLGIGSLVNQPAPAQVGVDTDWADLGVGFAHNCAIKGDHSLWCWGFNGSGRLGNGGEFGTRTSPVSIGPGIQWRYVDAGWGHTCAIDTGGGLWCWGANCNGQIGDGTGDPSGHCLNILVPTPIGSDHDWVTVAVGGNHTCAIKGAGELWCWGKHDKGQLGLGVNADQYHIIPVLVEGVDVGGEISVTDDLDTGVDGDGDTSLPTTPPPVWTVLSLGFDHSCGMKSDHSIWCWGANGMGQVGDNSTENRFNPVKIID